MAALQIYQFLARDDNYGVLVHEPDSGATAAIDAPDAAAVNQALQEKNWQLSHIFLTHHHDDHISGVGELVARWKAKVIGNKNDSARLPSLDYLVASGERFDFAGHGADIIDTPGHTIGHIAYHFADDGVAFVGDTLFALGCGRVFEGTMTQMWGALQSLAALPSDTVVYCGHEYTAANAKFCLTIEPDNVELQKRAEKITALRAAGKETVPTSIAEELATNVFLRAGSQQRFAEIRRAKDSF